MTDDVELKVKRAIAEVLAQRGTLPAGGAEALRDDAQILGGDLAMDSLDLATVVSTLEDTTGKNPFAEGFVEFRTVGELVALFRKA